MHSKTDELSEEGSSEPSAHQLSVAATECALVQTLSHHSASKLVVLQLQVGRSLGIRVYQCLNSNMYHIIQKAL